MADTPTTDPDAPSPAVASPSVPDTGTPVPKAPALVSILAVSAIGVSSHLAGVPGWSVAVLAALVLLGLLVLLWWRWFGPMRRLAAVGNRIAAGDFDLAVPFAERRDGVGIFARALQRMQDRLAQAGEEARERPLRMAMEQELSPDGILVLGPDRRILSWNMRFEEIWTMQGGSLRAGMSLDDLLAGAAGQVTDSAAFTNVFLRDDIAPGGMISDEVVFANGRCFERHTRWLDDAGDGGGDHGAGGHGAGGHGRVCFMRDITPRKLMEEQLMVLTRAIEHSPVSIMVTNSRGLIEYVNPKFVETTGYTPDDVIGHTPGLLKSGHTPDETYRELWDTIRQGGNWKGELYNRRKNGELFWEKISIAPVRGLDGSILHFVAVQEDITERKDEELRIWRQAHYDALTRLPNRVLFNDRLHQDLSRARRNGRLLAVMFVDLDRFKHVNDTLGHEAGDSLLQMVAQRLRDCVRESDTVSRVGGDEFIILLADLHKDGEAADVCNRIIYELSQPFELGQGKRAVIGVSIGVSLYPRDGDNPANLLKNADMAMYWCKSSGRNTYRFFSTDPYDFLDGY